MSDQQQKTMPTLEELKAQALLQDKSPSGVDLAAQANAVFAVRKFTDIASIISPAFFVLGGVALPILGLVFFGSAALGLAGGHIAAKREIATGTVQSGDSDQIKAFREAFKKAASTAKDSQGLSAGLAVASPVAFMAGIMAFITGAFSGGTDLFVVGGLALIPVSYGLALASGVLGFRARRDNETANIYEAAIRKEQEKSAPAVPKPSIP